MFPSPRGREAHDCGTSDLCLGTEIAVRRTLTSPASRAPLFLLYSSQIPAGLVCLWQSRPAGMNRPSRAHPDLVRPSCRKLNARSYYFADAVTCLFLCTVQTTRKPSKSPILSFVRGSPRALAIYGGCGSVLPLDIPTQLRTPIKLMTLSSGFIYLFFASGIIAMVT